MFKVLNKQILANDVKRMDVHAPLIARKISSGQFVGVCPEEGDERIPLYVIESDSQKGTITLIFHEIGPTTRKLGEIAINDNLFSILGPLGVPSKIEKVGTVLCIATGVGSAQMLSICRSLKKAGNKIIGIIGAKTKKSLMLEAQMRLVCNKIFITTNDGSYERRGQATDLVQKILKEESVNLVYAVGSAEMMQTVCQMTKEKNIPTRVHLTPVMVDCMGMCGSCRVKVGGKTLLSCVEGPEFDGQSVDFEHYKIRLEALKENVEWRSQKFQFNPQKDESAILTKFLSVFRRN
jgi:ferredoxin--NADP+ reductase